MTPLVVIAHVVNDGVVRLEVVGELDLSSVEQLTEAAQRAVRVDHAAELIVDLGGLTFLDSVGITGLIIAMRAARDQGGSFRLINVRDQPLRVLNLVGVLNALTGASETAPGLPT